MNLFDLHCDTLYECYRTGKPLRQNDLHINREAVRPYAHYAQFFALFRGASPPPEDTSDAAGKPPPSIPPDTVPAGRLAGLLATARREFAANADWLAFCTSFADLEQAAAQGKAAGFLSIEGAELLEDAPDAVRGEQAKDAACGNDAARLDATSHLGIALQAGVRMVTLSWNYRNAYACGALTDNQEGLSPRGKALVRTLTAHGVIIDVSHLSERGFWDVCEATDAPFVASHSNAAAVCPHLRNLTDAQFVEIARRGGLVGLNLYTPFLARQETAGLSDIRAHLDHFLALGGASTLALGCDFDGCDQLPAGIAGLADIATLADQLQAAGYASSLLDALFYDNAYAFIRVMLSGQHMGGR